MKSMPMPAWAPGLVFMIFFGIIGALFLHYVGIEALQHEIKFQFYADASIYHQYLGEAVSVIPPEELVQLLKNFLGPWLILKLAHSNYYAVMGLNIIIFWLSIELIARATQAKRVLLYILLLANPITLSSLLSVNKEIISLLVVATLIHSIANGSRWGLFLALVCSILVRWQLSIFCLNVIFAFSSLNPLHKKRLFFCALLLCMASVLAVATSAAINNIDAFNLEEDGYKGYGLFNFLVAWQELGFYWLVFIPKSLHMLFGLGLRVDRLLNPVNLYNDVWQLLHSMAMLLIFVMLFVSRRISIKNDLMFLSIIYLIIFMLSPIYVPRYFYPVYIFWIVCLACPGEKLACCPSYVSPGKQ